MQRDFSNPNWVAVVETRRTVDAVRRTLFKEDQGRSIEARNQTMMLALSAHVQSVVAFIRG